MSFRSYYVRKIFFIFSFISLLPFFTLIHPSAQPLTLSKDMQIGINLYSYPFVVPAGLTSDQLPAHLGIEGLVENISRFNLTTGFFETTSFPTGLAPLTFPIVSGEGYLIIMNDSAQAISVGNHLSPSKLDLYTGINLVGFVSPPTNLTGHDLLRDIGNETEISSLEAYDPKTNSFLLTRYFFGLPAGPDFQIKSGDAYFIYMRVDKFGWGPPNNPPIADAGNDQTVYSSSPVTLDGSTSYDPDSGPDSLTYRWTQIEGNPVVLSDDTDVNPTFTAPTGTDTLVFRLRVDDGKGESSDKVTVLISPFQTSISAAPTSGGIPLEVQFSAIIDGGLPPYTYQWDINDDGSVDDTRQNFSHIYQESGINIVTLTVTDDLGNIVTNTVTINALLSPSVVALTDLLFGEAPLDVSFSCTATDPDGTIELYEWDFDGDGTYDWSDPNSADTTYRYETRGLYQAVVRITDNDGLTAIAGQVITVGSSPVASAVADPMTGIAPLAVNFTGTGNDTDGSIELYEWDFTGDGVYDWSSTTSGNTSYTYDSSGYFNAVLRIIDNDGLIDTDSIYISVSSPPLAKPRAYPTAGDVPLTVTFFTDAEDPDGSPEFYDWDFDGDGTYDKHLIASMNTPHTYTEAGTYTATLQVVDNQGFIATSSLTINVTDPNPQKLPTAHAQANITNGGAPLNILLIGEGTDPDGDITKFEWDFEGDGTYDWEELVTSSGNTIEGFIHQAIDIGSYCRPAFVDIDNDGDLDLFVGQSTGMINFYQNDGDTSSPLWISMGQITDLGGSTIDVGSGSTPAFADIDDDGDMDLLVGQSSGMINFYRNDGDTNSPLWTPVGQIADSGASAIDVGSYSTPAFADIDNDGDLDMFIGENTGVVYFYQNDGNNTAALWTSIGQINDSGGNPIDIGFRSSPAMADIDNDGDMDLLVGQSSGMINFYRNDGDTNSLLWTPHGQMTDLQGDTIDVGSYSCPAFVDYDNDGDMDLLVGQSSGMINFYQNDGATTSVVWVPMGQITDSEGSTIDIGAYISPAFVDIDNDGDLDLFVGESNGKIYFYRNDGDNTSPLWTSIGQITDSGGNPIDVGSYSSPALADIDNDGDLDLFVGEYHSRIYFYQNDGDTTSPLWTSIGQITDSKGNPIDVSSYSSPALADIDNDGDLDLFASDSNGEIYFYRNDGDNTSPLWTSLGQITDSKGSTIDIGSISSPALADIDNDGDLDLFVGESNGKIYFYRNDGDNTSAVWVPAGWLIDSGGGIIDINSYSSPSLADIDNDGDLDLFIGENTGEIYFYQNDGDFTSTAWINIQMVSNSASGIIDADSHSSPTFADIDDDGDMDMLIGEKKGGIYFYRNDGNNASALWISAGMLMTSTGSPIDIGSYSHPALADIDNDGDLDLFVGENYGRIIFIRNDGNKTSTLWTPSGLLIDSEGSTIDVGSCSIPAFVDIDNDGDLDLFIGENSGFIYFYRNDGDNTSAVWVPIGQLADFDGVTIDVGSYSSPALADIDNDGDLDMLIGEYYGKMYFYRNDGDTTSARWKLISSQYNFVDVQSKSTPALVDIDNDQDYELFVGNAYGFVYFYSIIGSIFHLYTTPGSYQTTLRVTDNSGFTDTDSIDIEIYPADFPSAKAYAYPACGDAPLSVSFTGRVSDPDGTIILYEWDFDGDGTYDWSNPNTGDTSHTYTDLGTFEAKFKVTDNDGKATVDSVTIESRLNISSSRTDIFNPIAGQAATISSTISADTMITIKIIDLSGNIFRNLVINEARVAGSYTDIWDGKNDSNTLVNDGVYYFLIEYMIDGETHTYDLRQTAEFKEITPSRSWPSAFNPYEDDFVEVTYTISNPAEVTMYFWKRDTSRPDSTIAPTRTLFIREPRGAGTYTEVWDGIDDNGLVVGPWSGGYPVTLWIYELPDNAFIITGHRPVITDTSAEPNYFSPAYNPYNPSPTPHTVVSFNLSEQTNINVEIKNPEGAVVKTMSRTNVSAGANSLIWDGKNSLGHIVKRGSYSLSLTAINEDGHKSLPRYAAVIVYY